MFLIFLSFDYPQTIYFIVKMDSKCSDIQRASTSRDFNEDVTDSDINDSVSSHSSLYIDENHNELPNEESSALLKLHDDSLWEIFEWLSFEEIIILREKHRRLKGVIDLYIQTNYPEKPKLNDETHFEMFDNTDADSVKLENELEINQKND